MPDMQISIIGRIDFCENHNGKVFTIVTTPAVDAYSHPSRFKVVSQQPFGGLGQTFEINLSVAGVVREKSYRDKQTGFNKTFHEADVYLHVVSTKPYLSQPAPLKQA